MTKLSTKETAERLGVTIKRVQAMILDKRLPAEKMGRDWFVEEEDLALVADRKPGRPSKKAAINGEVSTATDVPDDAMPAAVTGKPAKKARKKGSDQ